MNKGKSEMTMKHSKAIQSPQLFVTVEIHNQSLKNKYRLHRSSVLNELKVTESILNESLNRGSVPASNFARIQRNSSSEKTLKLNKYSLFRKKKLITQVELKDEKKEPEYKMSPEIATKLQQITNISYQLEKACEPKRKIIQNCVNSVDEKYSLPVVEDTPVNDRSLKESPQRLKMKKMWKERIKISKKYTERMKKNPFLTTFLKKTKLPSRRNIEDEESCTMTPSQIRDKFNDPFPYERKSAPINRQNHQFFNQFCSHKPQKETLYDRKVELEPIVQIQQFSSGGESIPFKEYGSHINVKQFMRTRERITFLSRIYNHIKQKYGGQFKQMTNDNFKEPNLLSMVYYQENSFNMTQQEKKNLRKKLQFID